MCAIGCVSHIFLTEHIMVIMVVILEKRYIIVIVIVMIVVMGFMFELWDSMKFSNYIMIMIINGNLLFIRRGMGKL